MRAITLKYARPLVFRFGQKTVGLTQPIDAIAAYKLSRATWSSSYEDPEDPCSRYHEPFRVDLAPSGYGLFLPILHFNGGWSGDGSFWRNVRGLTSGDLW